MQKIKNIFECSNWTNLQLSVARKLHGGSGGGGGAAHSSGSKHGLQPAAELFKKMVETIRSSNGLMVSGGGAFGVRVIPSSFELLVLPVW